MMLKATSSPLQRYGVAVSSVAVALQLTFMLGNLVARSISLLFFAAVALSSWYGGLKPGIVAILLSALATNYLLIQPYTLQIQSVAGLVQLTGFTIVALIICVLNEQLQSSKRRIMHTKTALEQEMQEREQAQQALQESEAQFGATFNQAAIGIGQCDRDGKWLRLNQRYCDIVGYTGAEMLDMRFSDVTHPDDIDANLELSRQLWAGEIPYFSIEKRYIHKNGSVIWVTVAVSLVRDRHGTPNYSVVVVEDINDRVLAEERLGQHKELVQTMFDRIPVMLTLYNDLGQVQLVNPELERVLGWSRAELENVDLLAQCYPDPEYHQQVLEHQIAATGKWQDVKTKIRAGSYVDTSWAYIRLSNGMTIGIGQDITSRKQAEEASVLAERNRLAQEIHNSLAQSFAGIMVHLDTASRKMATDVEAARTFIKAGRDLAGSALAEARRSQEALRPQFLDDSSLYNALNRLAKQMFSHTTTTITCNAIDEAYPLSSEIESNLLRIGQEALTNAFKHAKASEVRIELVYERTQCILRIADNGQGFATDSISVGNGFGLLSMTLRAERIGAQLTIHSQPGRGTEVIVMVNRE